MMVHRQVSNYVKIKFVKLTNLETSCDQYFLLYGKILVSSFTKQTSLELQI